jgi:hypothetical protein
VGHESTSILNLFFMGEGPSQWLATGALKCRPAVALLAGLGAPQPNKIKFDSGDGPDVPCWLRLLGLLNFRFAICFGPLCSVAVSKTLGVMLEKEFSFSG